MPVVRRCYSCTAPVKKLKYLFGADTVVGGEPVGRSMSARRELPSPRTHPWAHLCVDRVEWLWNGVCANRSPFLAGRFIRPSLTPPAAEACAVKDSCRDGLAETRAAIGQPGPSKSCEN